MSMTKEGFLAGVIFVCVSVFLLSCWQGYVMSVLWGWFVTDTFGIMALNIPQAIGLSLLVRMICYTSTSSDDDGMKGVIIACLYPLFALIFGGIVTLFL